MTVSPIQTLYSDIRKDISKVESGFFNSDTLLSIKNNFLDLAEAIKLYLISNKDTYYGTFFLNLVFEVDFYSQGIAGIKLNSFPPTFVTNPLLLCKLSIQEIMFVFCHEIEHIILRHPIEMVKANPYQDPDLFELFNYAADASVNDRIENEIARMNHKFLKPPVGIIDSPEFAKVFNFKSVNPLESYIYYFDLVKNNKKKKTSSEGFGPKNKMLNGANESEENEETVDDDPLNNLEDQDETPQSNDGAGDSNQQPVTSMNAQNLTDHDWNEDVDPEELEANLREFVRQSYQQMSQKTRGTLPAYITEEIEKCNEDPIINWQSVLKKFIGTISANMIPTRSKLNRRQPTRFDLSGKKSDKVLKITVAIDTSGSMSSGELSYIFNEIFAILSKKKYELSVIEFDEIVHREYKAKSIGQIDMNVLGRGGTSFESVMQYINKDKTHRDALLVIFTDGYAEDKITKPNVYKVIWVITGKKEDLSVKEPYGMVLEMSKKYDY